MGFLRHIYRVVIDAFWLFLDDDGWAIASHIALSALMALFPFLIVLTAFAGVVGSQALADTAAGILLEAWPKEVVGPINSEINSVLTEAHSGVVTIGVALAVYFSSSGVESLRIGLNRAYSIKESRSWWLLRLESIAYVLIGAVALIALSFFVILGPLIFSRALRYAPWLAPFENMVTFARLGAAITDLGILVDDPQRLESALAAAAEGHDLVLTSGGVSTGEADHVRAAVEAIGKLVFWRVAIKPGRPVAMAVIKGAAFVGVPGNPVAAFVTFVRVVRPLLLRLGGALPDPMIALPVRAGFSHRKKKGRREYVRVTLKRGADGGIEASKYPRDGAGILSSLTESAGLVELDEETTRIEPGMAVGFLPHAALIG